MVRRRQSIIKKEESRGMKALLIEVFVVVTVGAFSISEGIRLVLKAKLHNYDILGPGYYSVGLGSVLIIAGLVYFLSERKKAFGIDGKTAVRQSTGKSEYKKMMISMIIVMIAYVILMYLTGYLFASLVFFFLINRIAGFRSWFATLGATVLMTASFYLVFVAWMGMIFPRGLLFDF
jgi:hypothetical protein